MSTFIGNKGLVSASVPRRNWRRTLLWVAGTLIIGIAVAKIAVGQQFVPGDLKSNLRNMGYKEIWLYLKNLMPW